MIGNGIEETSLVIPRMSGAIRMWAIAHLGVAYTRCGRKQEAIALLNQLKEAEKNGEVPIYAMAVLYIELGEKNRALDYLERACELKESRIGYMNVSPWFAPIRSEPRFIALLRKIGLSPRHETAIELDSLPSISPALPGAEKTVEFKSQKAKLLFDGLVKSFTDDYMVKRRYFEQAGWRTFSELSTVTKIPRASLYGERGNYGAVMKELLARGLVEMRVFTGERGRGGEVTRARIAYDKEPVKRYVDAVILKPKSK
jgi:tetratricopeptide (TPR) repeat protein